MHQCKHGCGYEHQHRGTMNLHENIHCKTLKKGSEDKPASSSRYCDCDEEPSWAFLDRRDPAHARAIAAGYKKICTECGEVI